MKKIFLIAGLLFGAAAFAHAGGATPVRNVPTGGPCTVDIVSVPNASTTSWTSGYVLQQFAELQSQNATDVYMGFTTAVTTSTGRAFYNAGDTLAINSSENLKIYFIGDGSGGKIAVTYCK